MEREENAMAKTKTKTLTVMGRKHKYIGHNETPQMLERARQVLEDFATGKTTPEKMAAEFAEKERLKVN
jgi:hypothetical protein